MRRDRILRIVLRYMKNVIVVSFKVLEVLIVPLTYFDDYFGDSCYFGDCEV